MYHVSAQGVDKRKVNVHYYYYLHACQVRVTISDSGLCCCTCVTYFERYFLNPFCFDSMK